jgi:hypothetical protein
MTGRLHRSDIAMAVFGTFLTIAAIVPGSAAFAAKKPSTTVANKNVGAAKKNTKSATTSVPLYPVQLDVIEASLTKSQQAASPKLTVDNAACDRVTKAPAGRTILQCQVNVEGTPVPYRVVLDMTSTGAGSFTTKATKVPIDTRTLQSLVRSVLNADVRDEAVIDCGRRRVVVVDPGAVLRCSAELGDDKERFSFLVKDLDGNVEMQR